MSSDGGHTTEVAALEPVAPPGAFQTMWTLSWLFPRQASLAIALDTAQAAGDGASVTGAQELVIGRDPACAVHLDATDISRRHAAIRPGAGGPRLVDLGSRNGIRVNGLRVSQADLRPGDVVRIGGSVGVVTDGDSAFQELAPGLWGGARLQAALAPLRKAAASELPIVLEGETGTGKEIVSRSIHQWSLRPGPLLAVNCAALPEGLAESELFGYRKGAFTGADSAAPGFFRGADRGTLLLDEVTDLPLTVQAKLLRVLEERKVQPLGEARPVPIDVRVIVAGQLSLLDAVRQGSFRADLLARLDGVTARLPPLRARKEDVLPLFSRLLVEFSPGGAPALEPELVERLLIHDWPFNVRELVLLVRRLLVLHGGESSLRAAHLPGRMGAETPSAAPPMASGGAPAPVAAASAVASPAGEPGGEPVEFPALLAALRASSGNVARAAAMLGITRQRAYRLMEGNGVDLESLRRPARDMG